jgi:hypothetical protein
MERTTFLEHYRVCLGYDGTPNELGRDGGAVVYEAVDERSSEPVVLTLVPVESIDPALREQFEEQGRAVQRLRHVNIAKVFDFWARRRKLRLMSPSGCQAKHLQRGLPTWTNAG